MNALITEGKDDSYFVAALVREMNKSLGSTIYGIEYYIPMKSLSKEKLATELKGKLGEIRRGKIQRIGVLIDQDLFEKTDRLAWVSEAVQMAFGMSFVFKDVNILYKIDLDVDTSFEIACHFINVNGTGELETLLKAIKTKDSVHADCLDTWRSCVKGGGKEDITEKEFIKMWMSNYLRLDTCSSSKFRGNKGKYCSMAGLDNILAREGEQAIFNLEAKELTDLKTFLSLFKN